MLTSLYRKIIPENIRNFIYKHFLGEVLKLYRSPKETLEDYKIRLGLLAKPSKSATEQDLALQSLRNDGISPYPYAWRKEYEKMTYPVKTDAANGLPYIMHQERKLYFTRLTPDKTLNYPSIVYRNLMIEQDPRSAHRYVKAYDELKGKTLLDIGTAEGIFTLNCIEYVQHAYLFECDERWVEALEATFAPWKEKVTIVRKYVSDTDSDNQITLDTFMRDKPTDNLFLKMDIEGYEQKTLKGAQHLLEHAPDLSGAVAAYHTTEAHRELLDILGKEHYKTETTPGFLFFDHELRRGIIRFSKS